MSTVTIIASSPYRRNDTDAAIEEVRGVVDGARVKHRVYDAPRPFAVSGAIIDDERLFPEDRPELVQIIGHGVAGLLELGAIWTHVLRDQGGYYVFDGNPHAISGMSARLPSSSEIHVIGCEVGSKEVGPGVADGPSLVYLLSRMTGCKVVAPTDIVSARSLDPGTGCLREGVPVIYSTGADVQARPGTKFMIPVSSGEQEVTLKSEGARLDTYRAGAWLRGRELSREAVAKLRGLLRELKVREVKLEATPLAAIQVSYEASFGNGPAIVDVMLDGRLVRTSDASGVNFWSPPADVSSDIATVLRSPRAAPDVF